MKRIAAMILTAGMIFTMTACGNSSAEAPAETPAQEEVKAEEVKAEENKAEETAAEAVEQEQPQAEVEAEAETNVEEESEAETEAHSVPDDFYGRTADNDTWGIEKFANPDMDLFLLSSVVPGRSGTTSDMIECALMWKPDGADIMCEAVEYHIGRVNGDSLESAMEDLLSQGNMQAYADGDPVPTTHGGVDCLELAQSLVLHSDNAKNGTGYWGVFEKDGQFYKYYYEIHKDLDDSWGDTLFEIVYDNIVKF